MRLTPRKKIACGRCDSSGTVPMTTFAIGRGKKLVARKCPDCDGKGKLGRR